jgi:hypothetical protein
VALAVEPAFIWAFERRMSVKWYIRQLRYVDSPDDLEGSDWSI